MEFGHAQWRKSSHSTEGEACVEIAHAYGSPMVGIRDSKNPTAGHLTLLAPALHHLTRALLGSWRHADSA
jgi:hypothetical protein